MKEDSNVAWKTSYEEMFFCDFQRLNQGINREGLKGEAKRRTESVRL